MITQAIKRWLRNMFAWWPWKSTPQEAYRQASGPLGINTAPEGISRSAVEGSTAQSSITPRLSTIEERPGHTISAQKSATDDKAEIPLSPSLQSLAENTAEPDNVSPAPTSQQRLEFLRYLVQRGIVNEGQED